MQRIKRFAVTVEKCAGISFNKDTRHIAGEHQQRRKFPLFLGSVYSTNQLLFKIFHSNLHEF